jgi:hypothetical protein
MEHFELWVAIAAVWAAQMKLLYDVRAIKKVIVIKQVAKFRRA